MLKNDYFCETAGLGIRRNNIGAAGGGNQQDTTVTLTAAPDEGYQLASPVTVKATFAPIGSAALPRPYTTDCSANLTEKKKIFVLLRVPLPWKQGTLPQVVQFQSDEWLEAAWFYPFRMRNAEKEIPGL